MKTNSTTLALAVSVICAWTVVRLAADSFQTQGQVSVVTPGCVVQYAGSRCDAEAVKRIADYCDEDAHLVQVFATHEGASVPPGECGSELGTSLTNCDTNCRREEGRPGICRTIGMDCLGEWTSSSVCECD